MSAGVQRTLPLSEFAFSSWGLGQGCTFAAGFKLHLMCI